MKKKRKLKKNAQLILLVILMLLLAVPILLINKKNYKKEETKPKPQETEIKKEKPKYPKEIQDKLNILNNVQEKIDYFNMDYLDRYINYKNANSTLSDIDIITRVNIGLDNKYYTNTKDTPYKNKIYILSNKYYSLGNYIPDNLEQISANCSTGTRFLVSEAKNEFERLCNDAKNNNLNVRAMSAYRSYDYQVGLYKRYADRDGTEKADTYSARPGFSEHQTGLVVDVDNISKIFTRFDETNEYQWMMNNAHNYGFIERYPKGKENITGYEYESWHYRYVGKEIATYIHDNNITFDEYYVRFIENKK